MEVKEIIVGLTIHLIIPLLGIIMFIKQIRELKDIDEHPKIIEYFLIYFTYGGLLILILTNLFWAWSGMTSLGAIYLVLIAPIIMAFIAQNNYEKRYHSKHFRLIYWSSVLYYVIMPLYLIGAFTFE